MLPTHKVLCLYITCNWYVEKICTHAKKIYPELPVLQSGQLLSSLNVREFVTMATAAMFWRSSDVSDSQALVSAAPALTHMSSWHKHSSFHCCSLLNVLNIELSLIKLLRLLFSCGALERECVRGWNVSVWVVLWPCTSRLIVCLKMSCT